MATPAASLKAQFDLHTRLFSNVLDGINDAESTSRNSDHVNHMKWIAGHLLNTRLNFMSRVAGLPVDETYVPLFGRGAKLDPAVQYPPIDEIRTRWKDSAANISNGLANVPEEILSAPHNSQVPIADDSVRGLLSFLISHEAYHIGQLGILRKLAGKEAMSYN